MRIFAYLDPGTGSMILQAVIGAVAGLSIFFRDKIGRLFTKKEKTDKK